jgi:hypothetical protein
MKTLKTIALALVGALAVALAHGVSVASILESTNTPSGLSSRVTCHPLHRGGIRHKELDLGNAVCRQI